MTDVARLADVSPMTVSRALRPGTRISSETRRKIVEAAETLGYVIDTTASGFASGRTGFVAMTIPSINNANFADTALGVTEGLRGSGLELLLGYTNYDINEEERLVETFLRRRPEAVVVTGGAHTDRCRRLLQAYGAPIVETWDLPTDPVQHVVGFSNARAGRIMATHLHGHGYRKIGFLGGEAARDTRGADRRRGFQAALEEFGLPADRVIVSGQLPTRMREASQMMRSFLDRWPDSDAVMCVSDLAAFGAMSVALKIGLKVPEQIAIAGFGAYDVAEFALPQITTIDVKAYDIGFQAASIITRHLNATGGEPPPEIHEVSFTVLQRASSLKTS